MLARYITSRSVHRPMARRFRAAASALPPFTSEPPTTRTATAQTTESSRKLQAPPRVVLVQVSAFRGLLSSLSGERRYEHAPRHFRYDPGPSCASLYDAPASSSGFGIIAIYPGRIFRPSALPLFQNHHRGALSAHGNFPCQSLKHHPLHQGGRGGGKNTSKSKEI